MRGNGFSVKVQGLGDGTSLGFRCSGSGFAAHLTVNVALAISKMMLYTSNGERV